MDKAPLTSLSPNKPLAVSPSKMAGAQDKPGFESGAELQSKMLQSKLSGQKQGTYVSPSDGIMSPCTQKLSALKGKRFASAGKPVSLFAKTTQKDTTGEEGFEDIKESK